MPRPFPSPRRRAPGRNLSTALRLGFAPGRKQLARTHRSGPLAAHNFAPARNFCGSSSETGFRLPVVCTDVQIVRSSPANRLSLPVVCTRAQVPRSKLCGARRQASTATVYSQRRGARAWPSACSRHRGKEGQHMDLIWIIIVVLVVLALLGYFGFGRRRGM